MKEKFRKHANEGKKGCFMNRKKIGGLPIGPYTLAISPLGSVTAWNLSACRRLWPL